MTGPIRVTPALLIPEAEVLLRFTRSAGPGGQNVNKVSTRVELEFNVATSPSFTPSQRRRLLETLATRLDESGTLRLASQESRSQWRNREDVLRRFAAILRDGLVVKKARVPTRATHASREKRVRLKKVISQKKTARKRIRDASE